MANIDANINAEGQSIREINQAIRREIAANTRNIIVRNPGARHNFAVAILEDVRIQIAGSVGYYCGGLGDGASIEIEGNAGWGLAESMLSGTVRVHGNAGSGAAAALRGGTVVIHGDAAARLGVSLKGGLVLVGGNCGYMAGFMAQKGTLIVCGDADEAFADSMYATVCYVGGKVDNLGTDAVLAAMDPGEVEHLEQTLTIHFPPEERKTKPRAADFKKVVSGRKLWNFDKREWKIWQEAL
jgi:methylamine---glutamate N-methyltransferase subunit B